MIPDETMDRDRPRSARRRAAMYIGRGILAFAVLLLLMEAGLRWGLGLGRPLLYVEDPSAGYLPAPGQSLRRFFAHISTNSFGMRSDSIATSRSPGVPRIMFVGDSVTFGTTFVDQNDIFTTRIKNWFAARGQTAEILNASAGGWAPANELGFLRSRGVFASDLVVLVLNTEDLTQPMAVWKEALQFPTRNPPSALTELWLHYIEPRLAGMTGVVDPGAKVDGVPTTERVGAQLRNLESARDLAMQQGARFEIIFSPSAQH